MPAQGSGRIVVQLLGREAVFNELSYNYPLKLLSPKCAHSASAIAYVVTYGGGLVGGDAIHLEVQVDSGVSLLLLTQGSTKVFETRIGDQVADTTSSTRAESTVQRLHATVHDKGILLLLPDPVTCFANATYTQSQTFRLLKGASAILLDWLTSGRMHNGEQWTFQRYCSINDVWVEDERVARDGVVLEEQGMANSLRTLQDRQGGYACYATVMLCGPLVQPAVSALWEEFQVDTVLRRRCPEGLVWSMARIHHGGVLRMAARTTEMAKGWLKDKLRFLEGVVGVDTYSKAFV